MHLLSLQAMGAFYKNQLNIDLSWKDRAAIFSPGYIFDIISDLLTITGTVMKINLDYDPCLLVGVLPFGGHIATSPPLPIDPIF